MIRPGKLLPVYATQWHPERPQWDWAMEFARPGAAKNRTADVVEAMQWMGRFCEPHNIFVVGSSFYHQNILLLTQVLSQL
jgi:hypothetical protein